MDFLLFIALIFYIVRAVKNAKETSAKRSAAKARAAAKAAAAERQRTEEAAPVVLPQVQPLAAAEPRQTAVPLMTMPQQRRHVLDTSTASGHAHTESSMTGFNDRCPPVVPIPEQRPIAERLAAYKAEKRASERAAAYTAFAAEPAPMAVDLDAPAQSVFQFDPARAREGLLYAEILGKPKALRR